MGNFNSLNSSCLCSQIELEGLFICLQMRVKWNEACLQQTSSWLLLGGLPSFCARLIKLEEGKASGAPLALGLQRSWLLANNLSLLWDLLRVPISRGGVFSVLFYFICLFYNAGATCPGFNPYGAIHPFPAGPGERPPHLNPHTFINGVDWHRIPCGGPFCYLNCLSRKGTHRWN